MSNGLYEDTYTRIVEPIYGEKRSIERDRELEGNVGLHDYSV